MLQPNLGSTRGFASHRQSASDGWRPRHRELFPSRNTCGEAPQSPREGGCAPQRILYRFDETP